MPIEEERIKNRRARSAKLRIARRTDAPKLTASHDSEVGQTSTGQPSFNHERFIDHGGPIMRLIILSALILVGLGTTLYQVKTSIDERQDLLRSLEISIANTKRDIAVLEAEWAYISRPDRVMALSSDLLEMAPIGQDRILPLNAIPMRIDFNTVLLTPRLAKPLGKKQGLETKQENNRAKVVR